MAVGVGLKNVTELRNVASEPVDDNAIALKDFEELAKVKQRIFNDLSSSVCPRKHMRIKRIAEKLLAEQHALSQ